MLYPFDAPPTPECQRCIRRLLLIEEARDVERRLSRLQTDIAADVFGPPESPEREAAMRQCATMKAYAVLTASRLRALDPQAKCDRYPKATGPANSLAAGSMLYWDAANQVVTTNAGTIPGDHHE